MNKPLETTNEEFLTDSSLKTSDMAVGTSVLITKIRYPVLLTDLRISAEYVGEIDMPVEILYPEMEHNGMFPLFREFTGQEVDRIRTAKFFVKELDEYLLGEHCEWHPLLNTAA